MSYNSFTVNFVNKTSDWYTYKYLLIFRLSHRRKQGIVLLQCLIPWYFNFCKSPLKFLQCIPSSWSFRRSLTVYLAKLNKNQISTINFLRSKPREDLITIPVLVRQNILAFEDTFTCFRILLKTHLFYPFKKRSASTRKAFSKISAEL